MKRRSTATEPERLRRVAIVDDHLLVLRGLTDMLNTVGDHEVVLAETSSKRFTAALAQGLQVDVAFVDVRMDEMDGLEVLRWVRANRTDIPVLMMSVYLEPETIRDAMGLGAHGFLHKNIGHEELRLALRDVHEGRKHYSDLVIESLEHEEPAIGATGSAKLIAPQQVPARAWEFLLLVMDPQDLTYKAIAERMGMSRSMVDQYFDWFAKHYDVHSRGALVLLGTRSFSLTTV